MPRITVNLHLRLVLDSTTLIVMTLVNFTICMLAVLFIWYTNRPVPGLMSAARGFIAISAGLAIAFFLKPILGRAAIWSGSAAMTAGMLCLLDGALCFRNLRRIPWWGLTALATPFLLAQIYLLYIRIDRPLRVAVLAALMALISFAGAAVMLYKVRKEDRSVYGVIAFGFGLYGATQLLRIATALSPGVGPDHIAGLFITNVAIISGLFGVSTATNARLRERIEKIALLDPLTQLPNRRAFDTCFDRVHTRSIATGSPLALVYIDLDRFKSINDRFGHQTGDLVLKQVADRFSSAVHEQDCLARLGGDEFAVLTERYLTRQAALSLLRELNRALEEPLIVAGDSMDLTASSGLAFYPEDVSHPSDLIREADAEMYQMKRRVPAQ